MRAGINLSRAERAPSAEELFSNGPHVATQAFEVGDPTLSKERSLGGELYARATVRGFRLNATVYANRFDNYIFQAATGEEEDGLPVFQYFQSDATHWGLEFGATVPIAELGRWRIVADAVADYVRATIAGSGPVPRIPPLRLLAGLEAESDAVDGRIEIEHTFDQNRVAAFETPTDGHTLVNASLAWRPWARDVTSSRHGSRSRSPPVAIRSWSGRWARPPAACPAAGGSAGARWCSPTTTTLPRASHAPWPASWARRWTWRWLRWACGCPSPRARQALWAVGRRLVSRLGYASHRRRARARGRR